MMIVLAVGMPRAGSGWHYNLVHDLMKTTGCAGARDIREKYRLPSDHLHLSRPARCYALRLRLWSARAEKGTP